MIHSFVSFIAGLDRIGRKAIRFGIVIVFLWIGALKFFTYEADGIVPFVANSPFMSFFYDHPEDYKTHMNKEGELIAANHQWQEKNNTYGFSSGLGVFLILLAVLVALHKAAPLPSMLGSLLIALLTLGTLSFLVTTPESWVPALGDAQSGFPYLSGRGRLVIKDLVILGAAILTMSESAQLYLDRKKQYRLLNHKHTIMKNIPVPAKEQVSAEAQTIFEQLQKRLGKVPNLYATIGYSAHALKGFLDFEATLNKGVFLPKEREAIALVVSEVNSCAYCLAAHTMLAIKNGFNKEDTLAIRRAAVRDPKLQAILELAKSIAAQKGHADATLLENFFAAGYNEAALIELTGLVTVRVFTNYVYALTDIPVDFPAADPID